MSRPVPVPARRKQIDSVTTRLAWPAIPLLFLVASTGCGTMFDTGPEVDPGPDARVAMRPRSPTPASISGDAFSGTSALRPSRSRRFKSRFDASFGGPPLTPQEQQGLQLFNGPAGCAPCHGTNAQVSDNVHNTRLDATITDIGAGNGRFKAPSLRNVAIRPPFMHDGRFTTLQQVVAFYDSGVQPNPGLDGRLRNSADGTPKRLNLTQAQRDAIVAYLGALTDSTLFTAPRFANPFSP